MGDKPKCPKPDHGLPNYARSYLDEAWMDRVGPLGVLRNGPPMRRALRLYEDSLVFAARQQGASWADVGDALDITRQVAHRRFSHLERNR